MNLKCPLVYVHKLGIVKPEYIPKILYGLKHTRIKVIGPINTMSIYSIREQFANVYQKIYSDEAHFETDVLINNKIGCNWKKKFTNGL